MVYISEKAVHQHAQNVTFGLFAAAWLFRLAGLVSYPLDEQAPEYLQVFERVNESHHYSYNTRHSVNALILPKVGSYGIKSFHYIGAKIWNSLPDEIQTTFSKSLFKVRCKKHYMLVL